MRNLAEVLAKVLNAKWEIKVLNAKWEIKVLNANWEILSAKWEI